ncbi:hypothetical protein M3I54_35260 [Paraburkholderia sp. CNPSo 3274]|uniref:hypothetical protein n=1 Tax=Paraburkholderia sp. CNPSo 3274 TaxID=2940932 RepID=UPI0020B783C6|nr:hypothetical protein [Paraburkholderia sp. CNPSo 3274]MCP3712147.1 hypothetical protein [Paraburkholderia sp. CNPSo 3274]
MHPWISASNMPAWLASVGTNSRVGVRRIRAALLDVPQRGAHAYGSKKILNIPFRINRSDGTIVSGEVPGSREETVMLKWIFGEDGFRRSEPPGGVTRIQCAWISPSIPHLRFLPTTILSYCATRLATSNAFDIA